jgi:hypothetical protein
VDCGKTLTRRDLVVGLGSASIASGGTWVALRHPHVRLEGPPTARGDEGAATAGAPENLKALRAGEYLTLFAASERIFPRDAAAGATDLGVAAYIDMALALRDPPSWREGLRDGLVRLDRASMDRLGVPYHRADAADQDALIAAWAEGAADDARFVRHLVAATLEGALCDPVHHGNVGGQGWEAVGLRPDPYSPSETRR